MRKYLVVLLALLMVFTLTSGARAETNYKFSVDGFIIDENEQMRYNAYIQKISTDDSVTAAESGKVFIVTSASGLPAIISLPDAEDGLVYEFVDGNGNGFMVNPDDSDTMQYGSLSAGEQLQAPGNIGDGLTIYATDDSKWFVNDHGVSYVNGL